LKAALPVDGGAEPGGAGVQFWPGWVWYPG